MTRRLRDYPKGNPPTGPQWMQMQYETALQQWEVSAGRFALAILGMAVATQWAYMAWKRNRIQNTLDQAQISRDFYLNSLNSQDTPDPPQNRH
jgi:hypothetical protein